jgi:hypothetical protein
MTTIKWTTADHEQPPAKERLFLIFSAAGEPPTLELMGKSKVEVGYWTGDAFRLMDGGSQPKVTRWARVALYLPEGVELVHERRFDYDARE